MTGMAYLDAVDPLLDQGSDAISRSALCRMSENRETTSAMDQLNRLGHRQLVLRNERGAAIPQISVERVAKIRRPSLGDHCARDMRPSNGAATRLLEDRREVDTNAELIQPNNHALGPEATHLAKLDEAPLELARIPEVQAENVRLDLALDRTQLDAGHQSNSERLARDHRFSDPGDRVVIGQRERTEANALGLAHDVRRRPRAVRRGGMGVEIDEWPGRNAGRRRGHAE